MVINAALWARMEVMRAVRGRLDSLVAERLEGMRPDAGDELVDAMLLDMEPDPVTEDAARFSAMEDLELAKDIRERINPEWSDRVVAKWVACADSVEAKARAILGLEPA